METSTTWGFGGHGEMRTMALTLVIHQGNHATLVHIAISSNATIITTKKKKKSTCPKAPKAAIKFTRDYVYDIYH